ncbi:hypothetical protein B0H15DRAFT_954735 [Mycena belliarum]|uniref:Uncharacterized protein n=1 Tax=Mycena belliarum TaxID=1033014 RepID=A0AAD6TUL5_9AGAR|nr:hypothetical protein B0H15DRAFT_954735 [Mycena belliae]
MSFLPPSLLVFFLLGFLCAVAALFKSLDRPAFLFRSSHADWCPGLKLNPPSRSTFAASLSPAAPQALVLFGRLRPTPTAQAYFKSHAPLVDSFLLSKYQSTLPRIVETFTAARSSAPRSLVLRRRANDEWLFFVIHVRVSPIVEVIQSWPSRSRCARWYAVCERAALAPFFRRSVHAVQRRSSRNLLALAALLRARDALLLPLCARLGDLRGHALFSPRPHRSPRTGLPPRPPMYPERRRPARRELEVLS